MKNTVKNNQSSPPLNGLDATTSTKPITGEWATAAQIAAQLPFLAAAGVDETFLRNRARETNPRTGAPWLPRPRNNQFPINPTILGLLEWFAAKAAAAGELPGSYDSMTAMANTLRTDKTAIKWLLKNGAGEAQLGGSRIAPLPVIRRAFDVIAQVAEGRVTGIDGGDEINTNIELGKKIREERFKTERENALAERRIHDLKEVEAAVRTEILSPVFNDLTGLEKKAHRLKYTPAICVEIVQKDFPRIRQKLFEVVAPTASDKKKSKP